MEIKIYTRTVVSQDIKYRLNEEEILEIQDEIKNNKIMNEYTLLQYLEHNFEAEYFNEETDNYEVSGYDGNLIEQIKKYKK